MSDDIFKLLIKVIVLFTAFPIHECAHAWSANKMGDPTGKNQGRITLNPIAHLDIFGTICMLIAGFGWAKPVQINPMNFKNPKVGMAISAACGPLSNILMAFITLLIYKILYYTVGLSSMLCVVFGYIVSLNLGLAVFNLLPIPPLDGSRIATLFLPERTYFRIMQYEQYIFIALLILVTFHVLDAPLSFLIKALYNSIDFLTGFIDLIFVGHWM